MFVGWGALSNSFWTAGAFDSRCRRDSSSKESLLFPPALHVRDAQAASSSTWWWAASCLLGGVLFPTPFGPRGPSIPGVGGILVLRSPCFSHPPCTSGTLRGPVAALGGGRRHVCWVGCSFQLLLDRGGLRFPVSEGF